MDNRYQNEPDQVRLKYQIELDQIRLSEASKVRLANALSSGLSDPGAAERKGHRKLATVAAIAIVCTMFFSVTAVGAGWVLPNLRELYHNSAGYQQSSVQLNDSIVKNGWSMTLTDCLLDEYNIYVGITITAPTGTALDAPDGYYFADWSGIDVDDLAAGAYYEQIADGNPEDNAISFVFRSFLLMDDHSLDGKTMRLSLSGLCHNELDEATKKAKQVYDCREEWSFCSTIMLPEKTITIEPNVSVVTLGVEATIAKVYISPLGAYIYIEGDNLKGHHDWVPKNASDGWYGCVDYQDVILHMQDGTEIKLENGLSGSGCSGGTDISEPGWLRLARRAETLIDIDAVDYIAVCGVNIPLR